MRVGLVFSLALLGPFGDSRIVCGLRPAQAVEILHYQQKRIADREASRCRSIATVLATAAKIGETPPKKTSLSAAQAEQSAALEAFAARIENNAKTKK